MPNVSGNFGTWGWDNHNGPFANGIFYNENVGGTRRTGGSIQYTLKTTAILNRGSNQYQSINEVRVKSIISNGYIRIF